MTSLVFLGSPEIACELLSFVIQQQLASVRALWTKPESSISRSQADRHHQRIHPPKFLSSTRSIVQLARGLAIPVYQPTHITSNDESLLHTLHVDIALIVAYGMLLPKSFFSLPKHGTFNVHFSLLPQYRGASPVQTALLNGETHTGVTIQKINQNLDQGDICLRRSFRIQEHHTSPDVFQTAVQQTKIMLKEWFTHAPTSFTKLTPQDHSKATFSYKIRKQDGRIQQTDTPKTILRKWRSFTPWPGIFFTINGEKYDIKQVVYDDSIQRPPLAPLTLEVVEKTCCYICVGEL